MHHRFGHINVTLSEVDFESQISKAKTSQQRRKWEIARDVAEVHASESREEEAMLRGFGVNNDADVSADGDAASAATSDDASSGAAANATNDTETTIGRDTDGEVFDVDAVEKKK